MPNPVDSDNDGIIDSLDQCQGTNKAFKVDEKGCPVMLTETISIDMNVKFPTNSAIITDDNLEEIKKVADFMKQFDQTAISVEGHSDVKGRDAYNKSLSRKRADAVRMTLIIPSNLILSVSRQQVMVKKTLSQITTLPKVEEQTDVGRVL
jgi:OOP family OmpA-OmpF porin